MSEDSDRHQSLRRLPKCIPEVLDTLRRADEVFVPFVVMAELHYGFRKGLRRSENERLLKAFLASPGVSVLWANDATVDRFADLSVRLSKQGTPIPPHDIWIAALALQYGLKPYARDKHFDHVLQIARV